MIMMMTMMIKNIFGTSTAFIIKLEGFLIPLVKKIIQILSWQKCMHWKSKTKKNPWSYVYLVGWIPRFYIIHFQIFEAKTNSNFRCFNGYPYCGDEKNRITWVLKKTCNILHDSFSGTKWINPCTRTLICKYCKKTADTNESQNEKI